MLREFNREGFAFVAESGAMFAVRTCYHGQTPIGIFGNVGPGKVNAADRELLGWRMDIHCGPVRISLAGPMPHSVPPTVGDRGAW